MAGALRKTMLYLGLSEAEREQDAYDADGAYEEVDSYDDYEPAQEAQVTPISRAASHTGNAVSAQSMASGNLRRITTVHPRTYNDAKVIGEAFRAGTPVIMNLTDMTDAEAKRLVDFSAGIVFGLRGAIERVTNKVFLLSPANVEVATEDSEPDVKQARFFNQS